MTGAAVSNMETPLWAIKTCARAAPRQAGIGGVPAPVLGRRGNVRPRSFHQATCSPPDRRGSTEARPGTNRILDPEHVVDALVDARLDSLHGVERQVFEGASAPLRLRHDAPGDVVGVAERDVEAAHQPIGESVAVENPAPATAAIRSGTGSRS